MNTNSPMALSRAQWQEQQTTKETWRRRLATMGAIVAVVAAATQWESTLNNIQKLSQTPAAMIEAGREGLRTAQKGLESIPKAFHPDSAKYQSKPDIEHALLHDLDVQRDVSYMLASTYKIEPRIAMDIVANTVVQSKKNHVDPTLLLGLMMRESSLKQTAKSKYGAEGLTQVVPRWHRDTMEKLGIQNILSAPVEKQVALGTAVLKNYIDKQSNIEKALQAYNGNGKDSTFRYATFVLNKRELIQNMVEDALLNKDIQHNQGQRL